MILLKPINHSSFAIKLLRSFFLLLYYSNVLIATAAAALLWQVQIQLHPSYSSIHQLLWAAVACFTFYNLHDLYTKVISQQAQPTPRQQFWQKNWSLLLSFNASILIVCYIFFPIQISAAQWEVTAITILLSLAYSFPVLPFARMKRWKNNGIWKICILAFVWSFFCTLFDLKSWDERTPELMLLLMFRVCFLLMITIPFDNRDAAIDRQYMHRSLLQVWSREALKNIILLLGSIGLLLLLVYQMTFQLSVLFILTHLLYWCLIVWWSLQALNQPKSPFRFLWLDAQLILQPTFLGIGLLDTYIRST